MNINVALNKKNYQLNCSSYKLQFSSTKLKKLHWKRLDLTYRKEATRSLRANCRFESLRSMEGRKRRNHVETDNSAGKKQRQSEWNKKSTKNKRRGERWMDPVEKQMQWWRIEPDGRALLAWSVSCLV